MLAFISDFAKFGFSLAIALLPLVRIGLYAYFFVLQFTT